MKKILYTLLVLFTSTISFAQQEASSVTSWDGSDKRLKMQRDSLITFSYRATENGTLYIYSDNQSVSDNVHVDIWGGWFHDGAYDADAPLQETGAYENGVGVYAWIKVFAGDEIRFTLSTPEDAEGMIATFTLKSLFFGQSIKGDSWEAPIALTKDTRTSIPVYRNNDADYLGDLSNATFCRFVAPTDGVASIFTNQYLIYYIEESQYGSTETPLKYVPQDIATDDHEFVVKKDEAYIVIIPNSRPTDITFKMTADRLGENCKAPIELTEFPASLDLVKGNNFYHIDLSKMGSKYIMELGTAAGWQGTITYLNNCNYESEELLPATIDGTAATFIHNLDPLHMGNELLINFEVTATNNATHEATISMREAAAGECLDKATAISVGDNAFNGPARDYWFVYTAGKDAEYSVTATGAIKHILYSRSSGNVKNEFNVYRLSEGETLYICVSHAAEGAGTISLSEKEIVPGDYCDMPITFSLGENIVIKDRGDNVPNFRSFTADKAGFATIETSSENVINNHWSIYFRNGCGGRTINYVRNETTGTVDGTEVVTSRSYKIPVVAGESYLIEIMSFANEGEDVIFTTRFEEAAGGDVCATAIEIAKMGDTIAIANIPESTVWHKYTAHKSGFYTTYAKIGRGSQLKVKVGDCDSKEINSTTDDRYNNAYMAGYKKCKVYVEEGQTLYISTTINADPGDTDGTNYYIVPTFAEARPGEYEADPIQADPGTAYTLTTGTDGYEMWFVYTLPAGEETTIVLSSTIKNYSNLSFYNEEKTSLSTYKKDYTQTNITADNGTIIGKSYLFPALEAERTIYIKAPIATIAEPVVWKIEGDGADIEDIAAPQTESTVIYDLMGRRVTSPSKGIYIINGKKVVIK